MHWFSSSCHYSAQKHAITTYFFFWLAHILNGHLEVVEHWSIDADVDKTRPDGWSPLHAAARRGHAEVVTCLMKWAAPLNARTTDGQLPIDVAANEAIKQLIRDEEDRRRNHGYKRASELDSKMMWRMKSRRGQVKVKLKHRQWLKKMMLRMMTRPVVTRIVSKRQS